MFDDFNPDATDREELEKYAIQFANLSIYCTHAALAKGYRLSGDIEKALSEERYCDFIYSQFPTHLRW